jgi:hypothetical protein
MIDEDELIKHCRICSSDGTAYEAVRQLDNSSTIHWFQTLVNLAITSKHNIY